MISHLLLSCLSPQKVVVLAAKILFQPARVEEFSHIFWDQTTLCATACRLSVIPIDQEAPRIPRTSSTGNFWLINHQQITIIIIYNCSLQIPCTEEPSSCLLVIYITHRSCKLTESNLRFALRTVCKLRWLNEMMCHGSFVYEEGLCKTKLSRRRTRKLPFRRD